MWGFRGKNERRYSPVFDHREVKLVGREMESLAGRDKERMVIMMITQEK